MVGSFFRRLWCSLTSNYDKNRTWAYCTLSVLPVCVFPFIYQEKSYTSCTEVASKYRPWCATITKNYQLVEWKYCSTKEYGGNSDEQPCVFPFVYEGRTYYTCTNENAHLRRFWCATTGSYDKDKRWSYCADTRLDANPQAPCVFPFTYKERSYSACTRAGSSEGKLWCSLTRNYDLNRTWIYCTPSVLPVCVFPFIYQGETYTSCTEVASKNRPWCATNTKNYQFMEWKYCSTKEYGGNSDEQPCVFPFAYEGRTYYTCTNENAHLRRFWCATTGSYDKDKNWSYCAETRLAENSQGPCVFPFIYKGISYSACTTAGSSKGKLWCSLTKNYDIDRTWAYCTLSEPHPCKFPFVFKGKPYPACTKDGASDGQLWCATTKNYNRDSKWKACAVQEYEGTSNGQACVFPFIYKKRTFNACTTENEIRGRFWCATTSNFDNDQKWSYCADTNEQNQGNLGCL
ncbi:fibronectin-like [Candoia aspera]|uniref:fibronectin-like n=1 Tax=Candoia aspera TaxID=51853 RepID=UPI002FD806B4